MGQVFASCGHEIVNYPEDEVCLSIMSVSRDGKRAVSYGSYCKVCAEDYLAWGLVLRNTKEEQDWFDGIINMPII